MPWFWSFARGRVRRFFRPYRRPALRLGSRLGLLALEERVVPFADALNPFAGTASAVGDVNGDGVPDLIVSSAGPVGMTVTAYSGRDGSALLTVTPFEAGFTGGVSLAAADLTGDGK